MQNPLALNWAQWLALLRYLGPELADSLAEPVRRAAAREALLDADLLRLANGARNLAGTDASFWPASDA